MRGLVAVGPMKGAASELFKYEDEVCLGRFLVSFLISNYHDLLPSQWNELQVEKPTCVY